MTIGDTTDGTSRKVSALVTVLMGIPQTCSSHLPHSLITLDDIHQATERARWAGLPAQRTGEGSSRL
jgi:hypothetical protein